jgi:hypothetical protein
LPRETFPADLPYGIAHIMGDEGAPENPASL